MRSTSGTFSTVASLPDERPALRMLAGCGEKARSRSLKPHLDDSDNTVRVAAINAARGIIDGEAPLDKLATFTAIEMALEWKKRL